MLRNINGMSLGVVLALVAGTAWTQEFPSKPIRLISAGGGGGTEYTARLLAEGIAGALGQPMIVDNRIGVVPGEVVAKAPPDGHMLLVTAGTHWIRPLIEKTPYDAVRDYSPITLATSSPLVLVVHPSLPVKSVRELVALAKARPGELNVGTSQNGTQVHLASELFKATADINIVRITYKSVGQLTNDLMGGHVQMAFPSAAVMPQVNSGRLRALAVTSLTPTPLVPGLPTVAAAGMPGFEAGSLFSVFAPAKTPVATLGRLNREMVSFLRKADVKEKFFHLGLDVVASTPDELAAKVKSETTIWGKIIKSAGVTPD